MKRRPAGWLLVLLAALGATIGGLVAYAAWVASSATGSSGQAKAHVMPAGQAPTAVATGSSVTLTWPASSFAGGPDVDGYEIRRFDRYGNPSAAGGGCGGVVLGLGCTEASAPTGIWRYAVTPAQSLWRGAEGPQGNQILAGCTINFTASGAGSWHTASNWTPLTGPARVPTTGDTVCLPNATGTVTYSTGTTSVNGILAIQPLTVSAGTLTLANAAQTSLLGTFTLTGGTVTTNQPADLLAFTQNNSVSTTNFNGTGAITVTGPFSWAAGTQGGTGSTTVTPTGTFAMVSDGVGSTKSLFDRTVRNQSASGTWSGNEGFTIGGTTTTGTLLNEGTLQLTGNATVSAGGGTNLIRNAPGATLRRITSTGSFTTNNSVLFDNDGTVDVQTGTLSINGGSGADDGTYSVSSGATLAFTGFNSRTINGSGGLGINSAGTVRFNNFITTLAATASYTSSVTRGEAGNLVLNGTIGGLGAVNLFGGNLTVNQPAVATSFTQNSSVSSSTLNGTGAVTVTGAFTWSAGTQAGTGSTTVAPTGTFAMISDGFSSVKFLADRTLRNQSSTTATWSGNESFTIAGTTTPGTILNEGTLELTGNSTINAGGGTNLIRNAAGAIVRRTTSSGAFTMNSSVAFDNDGTVDVQTGTLSLSNGSGTDDGTYLVSSGTTLAIVPNNSRTIGGGSINSAGTVRFGGGINTLASTSSYVSAITRIEGGSTIFNGSIGGFGGVTLTGGTMTVNQPAVATTFTQNSNLSSSTLNGTAAVTVTGAFSWAAGTQAGTGSTTVTPTGTFAMISDGFGSAKTIADRTVRNQSSTTATWSGNEGFTIGGTTTTGNLLNEGTLQLTGNATVTAGGGTNLIRNIGGATLRRLTSAGSFTLNNGVLFDNDGTVEVQTGTLSLNGGSGTDDGTYSVSTGATLSFSGNTNRTINGSGGLGINSAGTVRFTASTTTLAATASYVSGITRGEGGTFVLNGSIGGLGAVNLLGGILTVNQPATATSFTQNSNLTNSTLNGTAALTVTGAFSWAAGTQAGTGSTTVTPTGSFAIVSDGFSSSKTLTDRTVTNQSTSGIWSGNEGFSMGSSGAPPANLVNEGTLDISGNATISSNSGNKLIRNAPGATLRRVTSSGSFTVNNGIPFDNDGTVEVQTGSLVLLGGGSGSSDAGGYQVSTGATLNLSGGGSRAVAGAISGAGTVTFSGGNTTANGSYSMGTTNSTGGTATIQGASASLGALTVNSGTLNVHTAVASATAMNVAAGSFGGTGAVTVTGPGSFAWTGGTLAGTGSTTVGPGAGFSISGSTARALADRTLITQSPTGTWSGNGVVTIGSNTVPVFGQIENQGTLDLTGDATVSAGFFSKRIRNAPGATMRRTTSAGTFTVGSGVNFDNDGTLEVSTGTLAINGTLDNFAAQTLTGGTFNASGTLRFAGADIVNLAANVTVSGASGQVVDGSSQNGFRNLASVTAAGSLTVAGGKSLSITTATALSNSGAITVSGSGSTLTTTANINQGAGATTVLDHAGAKLATTGVSTVNLGGGTLSGIGTVQSAGVNNTAANISPGLTTGTVGTLTITGAYSQSGTGRFTVDVVGPPGTKDLLAVSGAAGLGGILDVTTTGFTPTTGETFTILTSAAVTGTYATVNQAGGTTYGVAYNATTVDLVVS